VLKTRVQTVQTVQTERTVLQVILMFSLSESPLRFSDVLRDVFWRIFILSSQYSTLNTVHVAYVYSLRQGHIQRRENRRSLKF